LTGELPGILNWALEGLGLLMTQSHFPEHPDGEKIKDEHRRRCDPVSVFLGETVSHEPGGWVESHRLFSRYQTWCDENNYRPFCRDNFILAVERILKTRQERKPAGRGFPNWSWGGNTGNDCDEKEESSSESQKAPESVLSKAVRVADAAPKLDPSKPTLYPNKIRFSYTRIAPVTVVTSTLKNDSSAPTTANASAGESVSPSSDGSTAPEPTTSDQTTPHRATPDDAKEVLPAEATKLATTTTPVNSSFAREKKSSPPVVDEMIGRKMRVFPKPVEVVEETSND